jgi:hypothetical protein
MSGERKTVRETDRETDTERKNRQRERHGQKDRDLRRALPLHANSILYFLVKKLK